MMRAIPGALTVLVLLMGAVAAHGGCNNVPTIEGSSAHYDAARVFYGPDTNLGSQALNDARGAWNASSCNQSEQGGSGVRGFPRFDASGSGIPQIQIQRANMHPTERGVCGWFEGTFDGSSATITVYDNLRNAAGQTKNCRLGNRYVLGELLAHELGHYLGLDDRDPGQCTTYIMAEIPVNSQGDANTGRSVKPTECDAADEGNTTTQEVLAGAPSPSPGGGTPILIDLDRDQFHLSAGPVSFDLDGDDEDNLWTWIDEEEEDAFLALDRNGNGTIDDGTELFGDSTPLADGSTASNGYIPLAECDHPGMGGNADGVINDEDAFYSILLVWLDSNANGNSESSELRTLAEAGVLEVDLAYFELPKTDPHGNEFRYNSRAWILVNGQTKQTWTTDVFFRKLN